MKAKLGIVLMCLGTALMIAALSLFLLNRAEDREAGAMASDVMSQLELQIQQNQVHLPTEGEENSMENPGEDSPELPDTYIPNPYDPVMTEVEINGNRYIGYVIIDELGLKLPVMSDYDSEKLRVAPCRYFGSTKTDNLVLMAHNYTYHFGEIHHLRAGSSVVFVDADSIVSRYEVVGMEVLQPTHGVAAVTAGDYDLVLFTCTYSGQQRTVVYCDRII